MHNRNPEIFKSTILITIILSIILVFVSSIDISNNYFSEEQIANINGYNENTKIIIPDGLVEYDSDVIWAKYNNPINRPLYNKCYLHINVIKALNNFNDKLSKKDLRISVRDCYRNIETTNIILNELNDTHINAEYRNKHDLIKILEINRSDGLTVDIEILDLNGNKAFYDSKYLNLKSWNSNHFNLNNFKFKRVFKYPWIWKYTG